MLLHHLRAEASKWCKSTKITLRRRHLRCQVLTTFLHGNIHSRTDLKLIIMIWGGRPKGPGGFSSIYKKLQSPSVRPSVRPSVSATLEPKPPEFAQGHAMARSRALGLEVMPMLWWMRRLRWLSSFGRLWTVNKSNKNCLCWRSYHLFPSILPIEEVALSL